MDNSPGWTQTKQNATSTEYKHTDGSYVRVDAYGNKNLAPFATANNAHVHEQAGSSKTSTKYNDRGIASTDPKETHIGMKDPHDLPTVRSRAHGEGGATHAHGH